MSTHDPEKKYRAPALAKGLEILELLSRERDPLNLSDMSARLGRSRSEFFRMVQELEQHGYIQKEGNSEGYSLTEKMFLLSVKRPRTKTLLEAALPEMRAFTAKHVHSIHLAIQAEHLIVVIARVEGEGPVAFSVRVGHTQVITDATSGIVLFAHQPEDVQAEWLRRIDQTGVSFDRKKFTSQVKTAKRDGVFVRDSRFVSGVTDVTAPILRGNRAIAAVTAPCLSRLSDPRPDNLPIAEIKETARQISDAIRTG